MPTQSQIGSTEKLLREFRRRYLRKEFSDLDESATRIMINWLLTDILGYKELEEIKTEFRIRGEYADYVVQTNRKKRFIVEVKSIQIDLNEKHLRQSTNYAANEGIDWILLVNGRQIELYRVLFNKPIRTVKVFSYELQDLSTIKQAAESLTYLSKRSVEKGELEDLWKKSDALSTKSLAKLLYSEEVVKFLRRSLKKSTGIHFGLGEISDPLREVIQKPVDVNFRLKK